MTVDTSTPRRMRPHTQASDRNATQPPPHRRHRPQPKHHRQRQDQWTHPHPVRNIIQGNENGRLETKPKQTTNKTDRRIIAVRSKNPITILNSKHITMQRRKHISKHTIASPNATSPRAESKTPSLNCSQKKPPSKMRTQCVTGSTRRTQTHLRIRTRSIRLGNGQEPSPLDCFCVRLQNNGQYRTRVPKEWWEPPPSR
jgi:hypothetical protein